MKPRVEELQFERQLRVVPPGMPNILTGGGPGTATQSLTLDAYLNWRALNLGTSAAIAYILLILVTVIASAYVAWTRRWVQAY